jgi:hypothetical protein
MSQQPAPTEFRSCSDPRRHVPKLTYVDVHPDHHHPVWQVSVFDHRDNHHAPCRDTWAEAKLSAELWVSVNKAHGIVYGHRS